MREDDLSDDVETLKADLRADRETIRLLAAQLVRREKRFSLLDLTYLARRGTLRPTQALRNAMRAYRRSQDA